MIILDIKASDPNFFISDTHYANIMCFLTFNTSAMIGSYLTTFFTWVSEVHLNVYFLLQILGNEKVEPCT